MHDRDYPTPWTDLFPVISKTLPADRLRVELDRMAAKWTPGACSEAGKLLFGNTSGEWTLESLAKVDAHLQTVAAMRQDSAMLERDDPKPAEPAPGAEDPLVFAVSDAITALREHMFECAIDEVQNTGRRDPDYSSADAAEAHLLKAIDDLIASRLGVAQASADDEITLPDWLLVEHKPGARVKGGAL